MLITLHTFSSTVALRTSDTDCQMLILGTPSLKRSCCCSPLYNFCYRRPRNRLNSFCNSSLNLLLSVPAAANNCTGVLLFRYSQQSAALCVLTETAPSITKKRGLYFDRPPPQLIKKASQLLPWACTQASRAHFLPLQAPPSRSPAPG